MTIEKKSLISTLKTTKKAKVASSDLDAKPTKVTSAKRPMRRNVLHRAPLRRMGTPVG